jgi:hypothetical protein
MADIQTSARRREYGSQETAGRTAEELSQMFVKLPEARLCFDIGHARQTDPTMMEACKILNVFRERLCKVHVSEVNST